MRAVVQRVSRASVTVEGAVLGATVATGAFGAHMDVALVNDGPVTVILDT